MGAGYRIRPMTRGELDVAIDWAADEGWNPGLHDADCFWHADPDGFLAGLLGGDLIASVSAVRYGTGFGFLGFYLVAAHQRGNGYGFEIWEAALAHLGGRTIGLDGVVAQRDNYRRSGFVLAHRNVRFEGTGGGVRPTSSAAELVDLATRPFSALADYDRPFFPADRTRFLGAWVNQPDSTAVGVVVDGSLAGYGVLRTCRPGFKVGPLFADDPELADLVLRALRAAAAPQAPVFLDVPDVNASAVELARNHDMHPVFETARMYRGAVPDISTDRTFGVTSFELG